MAGTFSIRMAISADAADLPAIEESAGKAFLSVPGLETMDTHDVWLADEHLDWMKKGLVWVAEDDREKLAGFLITQVFGDELHIWEISVHADAQGNGLGRQFVGVATKHAQESGLAALTLTTFRDVQFNQQFYAKLGFDTLEESQISARLREVLQNERNEGLPIERRCAMRMDI